MLRACNKGAERISIARGMQPWAPFIQTSSSRDDILAYISIRNVAYLCVASQIRTEISEHLARRSSRF